MKSLKSHKPVIAVTSFANKQSLKISEKAIEQKQRASGFLLELGNISFFISKTISSVFSRDFEWKEFLKQCYEIGNKSLGLVGITGCIMGLVLTIQSRPVLADFGAESMLPSMVAISIVREIGPVITALICAGKVGSGMGAELGSMKVTEQIDAMEVSATNPIRFLVVTRVLASCFMLPLLVLFADALGFFGSWVGVNIKGDVNLMLFFSRAFSSIQFNDFIPAVIKSFFFGLAIGIIGCYKGYNAGRGTESVGLAANSAVVLSSLVVIIVDMIAVQITDLIR